MPLDLNQGAAFSFDGQAAFPSHYTDGLRIVEENGSLVKLANVRAPLDKPTSAKVSNTRIANVYQTLAKGAIPLTAQATNVTGQAIFAEMNVTASDPAQPGILIPMQARIELKLPNHGSLSEIEISQLIKQCISLLVDGNDGGTLRVTQIMRGVMSLED